MADDNKGAAMLEWLENRHAAIMACEREAYASMDAGDIEAFRARMREKAENLASIFADSRDLLSALPDDLRSGLSGRLLSFANGAGNALSLDSVFYMSALLYPDDHKPGEQDNLARCMADFRAALDKYGCRH